jgi:hypothetical protein
LSADYCRPSARRIFGNHFSCRWRRLLPADLTARPDIFAQRYGQRLTRASPPTARAGCGKDEDEYLPLGTETFFFKSDLGSMEFSRDARGYVSGYTYYGPDGQEVHAKKIKRPGGKMGRDWRDN